MKEEDNFSDYIEKVEFKKITRDGERKEVEVVAVEKSYDLIVNDRRLTTIMASPMDLKELGYGYLISEGFVNSEEQILSVQVDGQEIQAFVEEDKEIDRWLELRSSGCLGAHWKNKNEEINVNSSFKISSKVIFQSLTHLTTSLYQKTSGSHSASLISKTGDLITQSVDVGRHNTFDKVIGKGLLQNHKLDETMILASGRQSAGMVRKAARVGIPIIVSKAAPLSSGIEAAKKAGLTLVCFAADEKFNIFSGEQRVEEKNNKLSND